MKQIFSPHLKISLLLLSIIVLGAALRMQVIGGTVVKHPVRADAVKYYYGAFNMKQWGIYSSDVTVGTDITVEKVPVADALRAPGVSFMFLPFVEYPPTERMLLRFNTVQAILSVFTIVLAYLFFLPLAGKGCALGAALLTAISPHLISMNTYLLSETQFTFLLLAGMTTFAHGIQREHRAWLIFGGFLLGASALSRPTTEWLPLFLCPFLFWSMGKRAFFKTALPALGMALAVIWAWKVRNLISTGAFSDPTLFVNTILHGGYPDFMFNGIAETKAYPYRYDPFAAQPHTTGEVLRELAHRAGESPLLYAKWYLFGKLRYLLSWNIIAGMGGIFVYPVTASPYWTSPLLQLTGEISFWLHTPLTLATLAGCALVLFKPGFLRLEGKNRAVAVFLVAFLLYYFAIHIVGAPFPRYGIPLRPFIYGFGLWTITVCLQQGFRYMAVRRAEASSKQEG
jgi:hypothetical protein